MNKEKQVAQAYKDDMTYRDIAEKFSISTARIASIVRDREDIELRGSKRWERGPEYKNRIATNIHPNVADLFREYVDTFNMTVADGFRRSIYSAFSDLSDEDFVNYEFPWEGVDHYSERFTITASFTPENAERIHGLHERTGLDIQKICDISIDHHLWKVGF